MMKVFVKVVVRIKQDNVGKMLNLSKKKKLKIYYSYNDCSL